MHPARYRYRLLHPKPVLERFRADRANDGTLPPGVRSTPAGTQLEMGTGRAVSRARFPPDAVVSGVVRQTVGRLWADCRQGSRFAIDPRGDFSSRAGRRLLIDLP